MTEMSKGPIHLNLDVCFDRYLHFKFSKDQTYYGRVLLTAWEGVARFMAMQNGLKIIPPDQWHITIASSKEMENLKEVKWERLNYRMEYDRNHFWDDSKGLGMTDYAHQEFNYDHYLLSFTRGYMANTIHGKSSIGLFCEDITGTMIDKIRESLHLPMMNWTPHISMANKTGEVRDSVSAVLLTDDCTHWSDKSFMYFGAAYECMQKGTVIDMISNFKKNKHPLNTNYFNNFNGGLGYHAHWGKEDS